MEVLLRSATADLRAAAGRRLHRYRAISGWRRQFLAAVLLTVAITALLASTQPLTLSSVYGQPSSTSVSFNSSVHRSLFLFPRPRDSSLLPYFSNSSDKSSVSPRPASEAKIDDSRSNMTGPSTSKKPDVEIKSDVSGSTNSEIHDKVVGIRPGDHGRDITVFPKPEISSTVVKPGDGERKVTASTSSEISFRSLPPHEALIFAKKEIENAPLVTDDPDLYAPLFLNVSVFKRSYTLMERILKVYIYPDGQRPIFHTPELKGIYASEGWFMKLIEQNRHFTVKDPNHAHLFYLPYSARRLEIALYVPESHNMKPLSIFLKDYVNKISSKYPFWNRTRGSDHFLVACHDWGPYTTTLHHELCKNTIKALCNADASEGIFLRGKDVSLPETTIRNPRRPLRQLSGRPVSQRHILAFFAGHMHGRVRPVLLEHWGNGKDEDMRIYGPLPNQISRKMSYIEHMKSSKFCICPMGFEVNSPRIVEAIYYECVPVIIADNFVLPFEELLDWSAFSVVVAEKDIPYLKDILLGIPLRQYIKMQACVKRVQRHFLWHARPEKYDLFHMILHSIWFSRVNHIQPPYSHSSGTIMDRNQVHPGS